MKKPYFPLLVLMLFFTGDMIGQGKVLGKPESFNNPVDYFGSPNQYDDFLKKTNAKSKKEAWLVISDRDNNPVYKSPGGDRVGTIPFKQYFYVVDEKDEWIEIVDARVDGLNITKKNNDVGWVHKKNMLLWNSGIVSPDTRIHRKALLLNRADNIDNVIQKEDKELVKIYSNPEKTKRESERRIFDFYFVLKKDVTNDMLLLSQELNLSPFNIESKLVGWVSGRDCDKWDTRICLEANIEQEAFNERKANSRYRLKAFKNPEGVISYVEGGTADNDVFWANDPVLVSRDQMAKSEPTRFKGTVVRFPMVSLEKTRNGSEYFISGLIGSLPVKDKNGNATRRIGENDFAQIKEYYQNEENRTKNVNVFFVVEATDSMQAYQSKIAQSIKSIDDEIGKNTEVIRFGALLYRGLPEKSQNRLTEHIPLTTDKNKVIDFINRSRFENVVSRSEWTAMYHGLNKALSVGGFREEDLNIVIIIGCNADFKADKISRQEADANDDPALLPYDGIVASINKLNIHLHAIQLRNEGYRPSQKFAEQTVNFILENAKLDYNEFQQMISKNNEVLDQIKEYNPNINYETPTMEHTEENNELDGSLSPGSLIKPLPGRYIPPNELSSIIKKDVESSYDFSIGIKKILSKLINEGDEADLSEIAGEVGINDVGPFEAPFMYYLTSIALKDKSIDIYDVLGEKFRLFTKVYIPLNIRGASYPAVSYSLFMPEVDVKEYKNTIHLLSSLTEISSYDQKREKLSDVYKELVSKLSGNKGVEFKNLTNVELRDLMQGIYKQGLRLEEPIEYKLGDIENKKIVSDRQVDEILDQFAKVEKLLSDALRLGPAYDFCYYTDDQNRYYWIPLRDAF